MICLDCETDLKHCTCKDLRERVDGILQSGFVVFGERYIAEIKAQAARNENAIKSE